MLIIANITPINLNVVNHVLGGMVILTPGKIRLIFCNVSLAAYILSMEQLSYRTNCRLPLKKSASKGKLQPIVQYY